MSILADAEKPGAENFCYESREAQNSCAKCRRGRSSIPIEARSKTSLPFREVARGPQSDHTLMPVLSGAERLGGHYFPARRQRERQERPLRPVERCHATLAFCPDIKVK